MSRNSNRPGETGYLYAAERREHDYDMSGRLRVAGIEFEVRCYLEYVKGTARKRWRMKLTPIEPRDGGSR